MELAERLERIARQFDVSKSDLIRQAVVRQLPSWEREGVIIFARCREAN